MSYKVGGVTVIDTDNKIDWSNIKNAPVISGPQQIVVAISNCATYGSVSASTTPGGGTGSVTITVGLSGGAVIDCDCENCANCSDCQCACGG